MSLEPKFIDPNIVRKGEFLSDHLKVHSGRDEPPVFSLIEFNLCGLCNRKCVFCPRADRKAFPNLDRHMSVDLYKSVVDDLSKINFDGTILYSAFSEPLLYKHLEEAIEISRRLCPNARIEMVTNGDLLTEKKLSGLFARGLSAVSVSMYDGQHQMDVFKNMKDGMGLDDRQFIFRVRWLPAEEHFGITLSNRAGAVRLEEIGVVPLAKPLERACYYPFYQILVDYDGSVLLCAHDWPRHLIAGNVRERSITDIWDNDILKKVRETLARDDRNFSPCDRCDAAGILIGRGHFEKWARYYDKRKRI